MLKCVLGDRVIRVRRSVLGAENQVRVSLQHSPKNNYAWTKFYFYPKPMRDASISKGNRVASSTMTFHSVGWDDDDRGA